MVRISYYDDGFQFHTYLIHTPQYSVVLMITRFISASLVVSIRKLEYDNNED
jgi:hypothetical protein